MNRSGCARGQAYDVQSHRTLKTFARAACSQVREAGELFNERKEKKRGERYTFILLFIHSFIKLSFFIYFFLSSSLFVDLSIYIYLSFSYFNHLCLPRILTSHTLTR